MSDFSISGPSVPAEPAAILSYIQDMCAELALLAESAGEPELKAQLMKVHVEAAEKARRLLFSDGGTHSEDAP